MYHGGLNLTSDVDDLADDTLLLLCVLLFGIHVFLVQVSQTRVSESHTIFVCVDRVIVLATTQSFLFLYNEKVRFNPFACTKVD